DKQGRFLVPANLRDYADIGLKQDVILTGADTRIEVWAKEKWARYAGEVDPNITEISTQLAGYGITI
ncbi:MAG: division/cell wall cluster transcriptional repressor MraZ, partial [Selenomonas sp.]|nr:division/cell wall cluster transcriptional repressor MraZ [Selenomonas sp.]